MQLVLTNLSKYFGDRRLFKIKSLVFDDKNKVGIIGRNGEGKTTLLNIITGKDSEFEGFITNTDKNKFGFLTQDLNLNLESTIYEEVLKGAEKLIKIENEIIDITEKIGNEKDNSILEKLNEQLHIINTRFEDEGGYKYRSLVTGTIKGLSFTDEDFSKQIKTLSGGQKMRVALAKLLVSTPEVLVLDEPTNYLDMESISYLENFLSTYNGMVIVVSHDRYFLDKVVNFIVEIEGGKAYKYAGNYSAYLRKKADRVRSEEAFYNKQQAEIKHQEEVIKTLKQFNREKSVKRARSREKVLAKMDKAELPYHAKESHMKFVYTPIVSKKAYDIIDLDFGYDSQNKIYDHLNLTVASTDKLGISGKNATGKSTFLKLLIGKLLPDNGLIKKSPNLKPLYYEQEHSDLNPGNTVIEEIRTATGKDDVFIRNLLGGLLFKDDDIHKKISTLSGGEKSRVALAKLMIEPSNVLILDEPTNHLDIATKEVLEDALLDYEGCIITVSHDRYHLNKIYNRNMLLSDNTVKIYNDTFNYMIEKEAELNEEKKEAHILEEEVIKDILPKKTSAKLSNNKKASYVSRLTEASEEITMLEKEETDILESMNKEEVFTNQKKTHELSQRLHEINKKKIELEEEWFRITEILEEDEKL